MSEPRIAVVIGSTRPRRICPQVASWAQQHLDATGLARFELLDLTDLDLPLLDEPRMAALQQYEHDHTKRWSTIASEYDGFVFVFPQYNWGYPAVLKNALDYLYLEWRDKPATTMTYGTRGGGKGADQLTQVLHGLHMNVLDARIEAPIGVADVDAEGQLLDLDATLAPLQPQIECVARGFSTAFENPRAAE